MTDKETARRPRGRPRVPESRSTVSTWLPNRLHDRLIAEAHAQTKSVSATVRALIVRGLRPSAE
jgi:hypothetical protein